MRLSTKMIKDNDKILTFLQQIAKATAISTTNIQPCGALVIPLERIDAEVDGIMMTAPTSRLSGSDTIVPSLVIKNGVLRYGYTNIQYGQQIGLFEICELVAQSSDREINVLNEVLNIDVYIVEGNDIKVLFEKKIY